MEEKDIDKKMMEMYRNNPDYFYKKTIDTLVEINLEYQIEICTLLAVGSLGVDGFTDVDREKSKMVIETIMDNHEIKNAEALHKRTQELMDEMDTRKLAGMETLGEVQ